MTNEGGNRPAHLLPRSEEKGLASAGALHKFSHLVLVIFFFFFSGAIFSLLWNCNILYLASKFLAQK